MATIKIRKYPDPILLRVAQEIQPGKEVDEIVRDLKLSMIAPRWGKAVGMAAPQVGFSSRVFMVGMQAFINPKVLWRSDLYEVEEGCFSLEPNRFDYKVVRPEKIALEWLDVNGDSHSEIFSGKKAQIIDHEFDHLEGKLVNIKKVE